MGIQDDIFDVQDAIDKLEDEGVEQAFDRLTTFYGHLEREYEAQQKELAEIKAAFKLFGRMMK